MATAPQPRDAGAHLTYHHLVDAQFQARPVNEQFVDTECAPAWTRPHQLAGMRVVPDREGVLADVGEMLPISLMRAENAMEAYAFDPYRRGIILREEGWGEVKFGILYKRIAHDRFECPTDVNQVLRVAVKILNKRAVQAELDSGSDGAENPHKEVARMRELENRDLVLGCVDYLQDDEYLYIVTPKGERSLKDAIHWGNLRSDAHKQGPLPVMPIPNAVRIFRHLLDIIDYLRSQGINHHDFSPDNLLIMPNGNLVVFDFAKSVRMPINPATSTRGLLAHDSAFGKLAWMCPLVFQRRAYDGCHMDLWAASLIFYSMLTNYVLYFTPWVADYQFSLFIVAGGLGDDTNELAQNVANDLTAEGGGQDRVLSIVRMAETHAQLDPLWRYFLGSLLNVDPLQRPCLAEVMENQLLCGLG